MAKKAKKTAKPAKKAGAKKAAKAPKPAKKAGAKKGATAPKPAKTAPTAGKIASEATPAFQFHEIEDQITINYKYSFGGQSPFFLELKNNRKIMGAKCPTCGKVYCPPRVACGNCYVPTEWVPLQDTGEIKVSTLVWYSTSAFIQLVPYAIGYIQLDGATTSMMQGIFAENLVPRMIRPGSRVRAVFKKIRDGKMTDFFFVPEGEYDTWIKKPEFEGGV